MVDLEAWRKVYEGRQEKLKVITVYEALEKVLDAALFPPMVDVYLTGRAASQEEFNRLTDNFPNDLLPDGVSLVSQTGDGREHAAKLIRRSFVSFCREHNVKPRDPYAPCLDSYNYEEEANAHQDALFEITLDEFKQFAKAYGVEVNDAIAANDKCTLRNEQRNEIAEKWIADEEPVLKNMTTNEILDALKEYSGNRTLFVGGGSEWLSRDHSVIPKRKPGRRKKP